MKRILFKGQEYLMVDNAITTPESYANFEVSFAHYYPDRDVIQRYGETIGTFKDITILEDNITDPGAGTESFDGFMGRGWFEPPLKVRNRKITPGGSHE